MDQVIQKTAGKNVLGFLYSVNRRRNVKILTTVRTVRIKSGRTVRKNPIVTIFTILTVLTGLL